ncbi:2-methylisocitrate lyase-like PEP mutase family enzyme [Roseibium hamelinense]|uniref:2-methylisocitrate lyase-like PEP mutase family enzyme n=1 Tax=Roseibium hamelinense TaxID=150831 RepID=A0A562SP36_9HYPH|nr:isocitrate lyase/phosphoenolpyruvate mutase family protein [Roseibium hamelinense]MTI44293.1 isocitrate lyase/phosphoenolpyruvate mutase family protein [Roseibium hamelinense]TWI82933.1 2-methylisocitrate lyase-like PEP mutase family enzyme [Roseibium hamelinense]
MISIDMRRERFKALHAEKRAFLMPNPFDAGTTRILEGLQFEALATTSAGHAFSIGCKDAEGWISRDIALAHAEDIVAATNLPVNGDLENGFGDTPDAVVETVQGAINVGLSGCSIEDYTTDPKQPYYELDLAVERIKAAVDLKNRKAPDFVLTARSEGSVHSDHDLQETIRRLKAFKNAGADCIYAPELYEKSKIEAVLHAIDAPINILAGRKNFHMTRKELADMGVARVSIGSGLARVAYGAFIAAAEDMKDGGSFGCFDRAAGFSEFDPFLKSRP